MKELISVIIPVYNEEKYIDKCLLSVINQTYKNIEIIIVNDGSTDRSLNICRKYKDKRIKIYNKENGGLSSARNYGLDKANGNYIYFIDSNDFIELNALESLYNAIKDYDIVIGNYYQYKDGCDTLKIKYDSFSVQGINKYNYLYNEYCTVTVIPWNKLYKKEIFNNLRYKDGIIHEDEYIITDILSKANKIFYLNAPLYHYRYVTNSLSNMITTKSLNDTILAYDKRSLFFKDNKELLLKTKMHEFYVVSNSMNKGYIKLLKKLSKEILSFKEISLLNRLRYRFFNICPNIYLFVLKVYKHSIL